MATIDGLAGSYAYVESESTYNDKNGSQESIGTFKLPIRVGSIPAQSQQRAHVRHLGNLDASPSFVTKNNLAGGYSTYITSDPTNQNEIYTMAGIDNAVSTASAYSALGSYGIHHPLEVNPAKANASITGGFKYSGMMVNQFTIGMPSDNSIIESSVNFIGSEMMRAGFTNTGLNTSDAIYRKNLGYVFESWNTSIKMTPSDTIAGWLPAETLGIDVYNFSITVNNNLIVPNFINSSVNPGQPIRGGRTVTGNLTLCYNEEINNVGQPIDGSSRSFLNVLFEDNEISFNIVLDSWVSHLRAQTAEKRLKISLPRVFFEQGGTPTNIGPGKFQVPLTFRAVANYANTAPEIAIVNSET